MIPKGVISKGIVCPIIREGSNLTEIVVQAVLEDSKVKDRDIVGITESVVSRSLGKYVTADEIASDVRSRFGADQTLILAWPIYSRNRFATILRGIARAAKGIVFVMPEYDEVGNPAGVNQFTGVNIREHYAQVCKEENCTCSFVETYEEACAYASAENSIYCGLHRYGEYQDMGWVTLADICSDKCDVGVLGSNKVSEDKLKLFPSRKEAQKICDDVKALIRKRTGRNVVVCVYGDGCFKDPVGGIWEFADPVTMPAYTDAELMESTPHEYKLKMLIDNSASDEEVREMIGRKSADKSNLRSMGTTPRVIRDLLASLMDLTSGSGDRQTPVVLIQNYFV